MNGLILAFSGFLFSLYLGLPYTRPEHSLYQDQSLLFVSSSGYTSVRTYLSIFIYKWCCALFLVLEEFCPSGKLLSVISENEAAAVTSPVILHLLLFLHSIWEEPRHVDTLYIFRFWVLSSVISASLYSILYSRFFVILHSYVEPPFIMQLMMSSRLS